MKTATFIKIRLSEVDESFEIDFIEIVVTNWNMAINIVPCLRLK